MLDIFTLFFLMMFTGVAVVSDNVVFRALPRAPGGARRWQCHLQDALLLVIQLGLAGLLVFEPDPATLPDELADIVILWALQCFWWSLGIQHLSRAGVSDPLRRMVVLGIVAPLAYGWPLIVAVVNPLIGFILYIPLSVVWWILMRLCRAAVTWVAKPPEPQPRAARTAAWAICALLTFASLELVTLPPRTNFIFGPSYYTTALRKFRRQMRRQADVPSIQEWLKSFDMGNALPYTNVEIGSAKLPRCVTSLSSDAVLTPEGWLRLYWGGGFGHWGLVVQPRGTRMPPSHSREYHLLLRDGAYVWHEIQ